MKQPTLDEVIKLANEKGIKPNHIAKALNKSTETVYRYFQGQDVSHRTATDIINFVINKK